MADTLRFRKLATEEELGGFWPGGEENKDETVRGWIHCVANYTRFCDRIPSDSEAKPVDNSVLDDALLDYPETVLLSGELSLSVYPKSFSALRFIERCDQRIQWLAAKRVALAEGSDTSDLDFLERVVDEMEHQYRVIAWVATFKEPGLPFPDEEMPIGVPDQIRDLSPTDYMMLRVAFLRVNQLRLALLIKMLSEQTGEEPNARDSWSTFFANQESEGHGPARHLMRDRSLVSQLAAALKTGESRRIAEERAKRKEA